MTILKNSVECIYRDEDRASGVVRTDKNLPIPWTAIRSNGTWYAVINAQWEGDRTPLRLVLDSIKNLLEEKAAAA